MEEIFDIITMFINSLDIFSGLIGCLLTFLVSIIPFLPLFVPATVNYYYFGPVLGYLLTYIFSVLGAIASYLIFSHGFFSKFEKKLLNKDYYIKYKKIIKNISLTTLMLLTSVPLSPAFVVNIICGISKTDFKKYVISIVFGKIVLTYYSTFIGTSLLESFKNPLILIRVFFIIVITYVVSKILAKAFNL